MGRRGGGPRLCPADPSDFLGLLEAMLMSFSVWDNGPTDGKLGGCEMIAYRFGGRRLWGAGQSERPM